MRIRRPSRVTTPRAAVINRGWRSRHRTAPRYRSRWDEAPEQVADPRSDITWERLATPAEAALLSSGRSL